MVQAQRTLTTPGGADGQRSPRRRLLARFSLAHGLMALSGLLAFVLVAAVLGDRDEVVTVAVARSDLVPGTVVTPSLVGAMELPADSELLETLVRADALGDGGWVVARSVPEGEPLRHSDLSRGETVPVPRAVSVPVPREHAVGGDLRVGDRVDVVDVVDGVATYVVTDVEVVRVASEGSSGGITGGTPRGFFVVVMVDANQALAIAEALDDGKLEVVRSTGAAPVVR